MSNILSRMAAAALAVVAAVSAAAQIKLPAVLSDNMVLQRGMPVPVWGTAAKGERVTVTFGGQKHTARAGKDGRWSVSLRPMEADSVGKSLVVKGRRQTITLGNVLVGEVWIASGQSNMAYKMKLERGFQPPHKGRDLAADELRKPANPMIRVFVSDRHGKSRPWAVAGGQSLEDVSAPGYFFIKQVRAALGVPVGIITAALGGTRIEAWTPREAYLGSAVFAGEMQSTGRISGLGVGERYEKQIAPIVPFAVKGFLWYQGENNCGIGDMRYAEKYRVMTDWWRKQFANPGAPFYSVMLGPHIYSNRLHRHGKPQTAEALPLFREQQKATVGIVPNSEYTTVNDLCDDLNDIHSSYKWEVGARLARLARRLTYGEDSVECFGPRLAKVVRQGGSLMLSFSNTGSGLQTTPERRLMWFEVAGADGVFRPAVADISGQGVLVGSPHIAEPVYVRYCWHEQAQPNLFNSAGLPAEPFAAVKAAE